MRRFQMIVSLLAIGLIILSGCAQVYAADPQTIAADTQTIVNEVKNKGNAIFDEIQADIDTIKQLKADIEANTTDKQTQLTNVVTELKKVTESYEKLAEQHDSIKTMLLSKIDDIQALQAQVQTQTELLITKKADYAAKLKAVNNPDPNVARAQSEALTQTVKYVDMQIELWNNFHSTEQAIQTETQAAERKIDNFLSVIGSTAIMFREGLNLLQLQKNIDDALSLFTEDMPEVDRLTQDMQSSWSTLDELVNSLTQMSISITPAASTPG